jgi:hypothetical protein
MAIGPKKVLSWPPGSGGDMVRSCLYPLTVTGNWEYKIGNPGDFPEHAANKNGLYWNDNLITYIDHKGQAQTPIMWHQLRWDEHIKYASDEEPNKDLLDLVFSIHKRHHSERDIKLLIEIQVEAYFADELNPCVTYIAIKDNKYVDLAKKLWTLKTKDDKNPFLYNYISDRDIWIKRADEDMAYRIGHCMNDKSPYQDCPHQPILEWGDRKHMMFMDNFFNWELFEQELRNYLGFYIQRNEMPIARQDNMHIVKGLWQDWIDGQPIKVE